jgi:RNA-directed DNA polymerase
MAEDAPGNPGAVAWPDEFTASVMVRRMQDKLHRWAGEEPSRRFGDLFNLVYDPAFLVHGWDRVAGSKGARTPGIDRVKVAWIESRIGVAVFLGQIRDSLKSGGFRPVEVLALGAVLLGRWLTGAPARSARRPARPRPDHRHHHYDQIGQ